MKRAVRNLIRLLASGLIVFGGIEIGLEFARHRVKNVETNPWHYVLGSLQIVFGIILFVISSRAAARLTGEFDDDKTPSPPSNP
jgi:divalent metal cation (Fe/Co/Zn/Cd) transporter